MRIGRKDRAAGNGSANGAERVFFATDLHGSEICFRKLLAAPKHYGATTVIMGGDCTGKMLIPVVEGTPGRWTCEWAGEKRVLESEDKLEELLKQIRYSGLYPARLGAEDAARLDGDTSLVEALFSERMLVTLREWIALAEERLADSGVHLIMTPGNDDEFDVDEVIRSSQFVDGAEGRITRIGPHEMLSVGWSNPTPWQTPRECAEEELKAKIDALAADIEDMPNAIFNIHVPPYGTGLDEAPELDENQKPVQGGQVMTSVGSTAVRDAILEYAPLLSLHGHIHESRGVQKLGRTTCINPGSVYGDWTLQGVVVDLKPGAVAGYTLTAG